MIMDDKNFEALPVIDKTEFSNEDFPDLMNNKKTEINKEGNENE